MFIQHSPYLVCYLLTDNKPIYEYHIALFKLALDQLYQ